MKRWLILTLVVLLLCGCSRLTNNSFVTSPPKKTHETDKKDIREFISRGKVDTIKFGIGDNANDIISDMGEPITKDDFMGGAYLSYEGVTFFIDQYIEDLDKGKVVMLGFKEGSSLFDITVGTKFKDIINKLGKPDYEGIIGDDEDASDIEDALFYKSMSLIYRGDNYQLLFIGEVDSDFPNQAYLQNIE